MQPFEGPDDDGFGHAMFLLAMNRRADRDADFGIPVQWLALGRTQLHHFERAPGNLVEIDQHGADRLPDDMRARLKGLWDFNPQDDEQLSARLFVPD